MEMKEEKNRFVLYNQGIEIGEMTWSNAGEDVMIIDRTFVNPAYQGQGLAKKLLSSGVEKARLEQKKIIPRCLFANKEFKENPDYADIWKKD